MAHIGDPLGPLFRRDGDLESRPLAILHRGNLGQLAARQCWPRFRLCAGKRALHDETHDHVG